MRVLIVSDTHGRHAGLEKALEKAGKIDYLVHLGDTEGGEFFIEAICHCPAYIVAGNNDFFSELPKEMEIRFGSKKAFMTHGHYYYVSLGPERLIDEGKARGADIVMFGHTHKPYLEEIDGMTILNPGSLSYPRQQGRRGSFIIMEMDPEGHTQFSIDYI